MNKELAAVIVETRPLPNLKEVIQNHLKFLPEYTQLYLFGSIASEAIVFGADLGIDYKFIRVDGVINETEYNKLLTSTTFWNLISEENILIFQHDSELLREGIEEFYQYDYVGAPWKFQNKGGNGGLSFRHRSVAIECINKWPYNQSEMGNEDIYFSQEVEILGKNLAPREVCSSFSCETIFHLGTFGCHAIDKYLGKEQCQQIRNQYK